MTASHDDHHSRAQKTMETAMKGFWYMFTINLLSKVVTFGFNASLIRYTAPTHLGARFNIDLWVNSAFFLTSEAFRTAAGRLDASVAVPNTEARRNFAYNVNAGWIDAACGWLLAVIAGWAFMTIALDSAEFSAIPDIHTVSLLYFFGLMLEVASEPMYIAAQGQTLFTLRTRLEALSLMGKHGVSAFLIIVAGVEPLMSFALAQITYGLILTVGYWGYFLIFFTPHFGGRVSLLPQLVDGRLLPRENVRVVLQLQCEAVLRFLLTEGEKVILTMWAVLSEQGIFEVVSYLGSIVCRIFFKFVEEISLTTWSKLLAAKAVAQAAAMLHMLGRLLMIVGLVFITWGPPFSHALLFLLYGDRWVATSAPALLSLYCVYVPIMGINGISEAFYRASASSDQLQRLWRWQAGFSTIYLVGCWMGCVWLDHGSFGLVISNCTVMLARIAFSVHFMYLYFEGKVQFSVANWVPRPIVLVVAAASSVICFVSESLFYQPKFGAGLATHIFVGACTFLAFILTVYFAERDFLAGLRALYKKRAE